MQTNNSTFWHGIPLGNSGNTHGRANVYSGSFRRGSLKGLTGAIDVGPFNFSPLTKLFRDPVSGFWHLNIGLFIPKSSTLDFKRKKGVILKHGVNLAFRGGEVFIFVNLTPDVKRGKPPVALIENKKNRKFLFVDVEFNSSFVRKIKGKNIYIIVAHGDPEEGEITKVIIEDEDEI